MEKCCPWKPTSLHTNCVILLMCLFMSIFVHTVSAHVDFMDAVLILPKSWSQLCQVLDELVAAIQHCEKEKRKVKIITVFMRTGSLTKKKIKPPVFVIKQYRKLEFLVPNVSVTGTTLSLRDFFCRELPSVLWWKLYSLFFIMTC